MKKNDLYEGEKFVFIYFKTFRAKKQLKAKKVNSLHSKMNSRHSKEIIKSRRQNKTQEIHGAGCVSHFKAAFCNSGGSL